MEPVSLSWSKRFINALPPTSDGFFVGWLLFMVLLLGMCFGIAWCAWSKGGEIQRLSVQQQIDLLETRLRTLERRQPQE